MLALFGCDQQHQQAEPAQPAPELGRWTVIPASNEPVLRFGDRVFSAWRLDTKTGALEFCTFSTDLSDGATSAPTPDEFSCSGSKQATSD
jgi:hypothetical protein